MHDLYAAALRSMRRPGGVRHWYSRWEDGERSSLGAQLHRWCGPADPTDLALLRRSHGMVLDVGCGPGRLVTELTRQRRQTAGVDTSAAAVALARRTSAAVFHRSVFDPLPGEGRWDTVLLADGNVGIGGDPVALLARCRELIDPRGTILAELRTGATGLRTGLLRLESDTQNGGWFPWADLGPDAIDGAARAAGLHVDDAWQHHGRSFAALSLVRGRG
ncbi:methyltransferase domain-containing protein [Petropleomorpha daqingensis]|uniref:SAM-dependent methyltransferase n=1 Tax=Petropleomorpha daqingensis TaxID=2026353 RepID=A0A853CHD8_9ACTN|nr:methyltransferase domain-containing protein [Petropleomorpha daqingensis]NYJ07220.1 SAM-dependent methyltransferase [Petropleomorpha daqingensis]